MRAAEQVGPARVRPEWFPYWAGLRCVIVASGPSAATVPLEQARGRVKVIAVNDSWRLVPWADALYASDGEWWLSGKADGFAGLRVSRSHLDQRSVPDVKRVALRPKGKGPRTWEDRLIFDDPGVLGAGGSSGFQALNLAVQFGPPRSICLVGFDARVDLGLHWHGAHDGNLQNPRADTALVWVKHLDAAAIDLRARDIEAVNASAVSALTQFPKVTFEEWLAR